VGGIFWVGLWGWLGSGFSEIIDYWLTEIWGVWWGFSGKPASKFNEDQFNQDFIKPTKILGRN
jgi:Na+-driven multidrug efflux pump